MKKLLIVIPPIMLLFTGCAIRYSSNVRLHEPIPYKTKLFVGFASSIPFVGAAYYNLDQEIIAFVRDDLMCNVFPNITISSDNDISVETVIQSISSNMLTGGANATIVLTIKVKDKVVRQYTENGSVGIGLTLAKGIVNCVKKAVEKIKFKIINEREVIISEIENLKHTNY